MARPKKQVITIGTDEPEEGYFRFVGDVDRPITVQKYNNKGISYEEQRILKADNPAHVVLTHENKSYRLVLNGEPVKLPGALAGRLRNGTHFQEVETKQVTAEQAA